MVTEAAAASAWKDPLYSYGYNNISDLGVPSCGGQVEGRTICSPLSVVMNTGFVLQGVLFVVAAFVLFRLLPGRLRWAYLILAAVHGVGITLVGLVHGSPEAVADGSITWHVVGAALAIVGGNLVSIVVGCHVLRSRLERWLGIVWVVLGVLGIASLALMTTFTGDANFTDVISWFERGAVYPIMAAESVAGVALLYSRRSGRRFPAEPTPATAAS